MNPGISIIICCYNSSKRLPLTVEHILDQKNCASINWEVIIVDNASSDNTFELAHKLLINNGVDFTVVKEPLPGLANARLKGYNAAKYDYLLYCDDDNYLDNLYLFRAFETMQNNAKIGVLGGIGEAVFEDKEPAWFAQHAASFAVGDQSFSRETLSKVNTVYGAGAIMRKEFLYKLYKSGFKSLLLGRTGNQITSGDDNELCFMARILGYEVWFDRNLKFKHLMTPGRMNWKYLQKLYAGFGRVNVYIGAYTFIETHNGIPRQNLRLPFWLDTFIHKAKAILEFYPKVRGKMNVEGDEDVLRFIAMKSEAREIWRLKKKYSELYINLSQMLQLIKA